MSTTIHHEEGLGGDHVIVNGGGADSNMRKKEEEDHEESREEEIKEELLPYLNEDMVTKIIVKTPAEARVNRLRYVCKPWYNLINNDPGMALYRLLSSKSSCLILQTQERTSHRYMNTGIITGEEVYEITHYPIFTTSFIKMGVEGKDQEDYDLTTPFRKLCILACANGLMLTIARPEGIFSNCKVLYYVVNPLMNQTLRLPFPLGIKYFLGPGFIFLPSTGEYKIIVTMGDLSRKYMHILTLSGGSGGSTCSPWNNNVDDHMKWRLVEAPPDKLESSPLAVNEIFYWIDDTKQKDYMVSFDARAEKFYTTPHMFRRLRTHREQQRKGGFIEMGGYLCFWHMAGLLRSRSYGYYSKFDIWILKEYSFKREWTKQYSITMDLDFMRPMRQCGQVALSFGNGEVIIFKNIGEKTLWAYNVKSNQWWKLGNNLKDNDYIHFCGFHVNNTLDLKSLFSTEVEVPDLRSLFESE